MLHEHLVDALDDLVGDHSRDALDVLRREVLRLEGARRLEHVDAASQVALGDIDQRGEDLVSRDLHFLVGTDEFESLHLSLFRDGREPELDAARGQRVDDLADVVANNAEARRC